MAFIEAGVTIRFADGARGGRVMAAYSGRVASDTRSGRTGGGEIEVEVDSLGPPWADGGLPTRDGRCSLTFEKGDLLGIRCGAKASEAGVVTAVGVSFDVLPGQWREHRT